MADIAMKFAKMHDDMLGEGQLFPMVKATDIGDGWFALACYEENSDAMLGNQTTIINNQTTIINLLTDIKAKLDVGINVKIVTSF